MKFKSFFPKQEYITNMLTHKQKSFRYHLKLCLKYINHNSDLA